MIEWDWQDDGSVTFIITCDVCEDTTDDFDGEREDFRQAVDYFKGNGWQMIPMGGKDWEHRCS